MTNFQGTATPPPAARWLLWAPIAIGGLLAAGVLGIGLVPLVSQLQIQSRQQLDRQAQLQRLPQLRAQTLQVATAQVRAERQQQQLLQLIAGSGQLVTFMAQVDLEAQRQGVQLQLLEPQPASEVPGPSDPLKGQSKGASEQQAQAAEAQRQAAAADPMQKAGLGVTKLLLSAKGRYPNLLSFLRNLESLGLLVVQSDLSLSQWTAAATPSSPPVELKLALALYSPAGKK